MSTAAVVARIKNFRMGRMATSVGDVPGAMRVPLSCGLLGMVATESADLPGTIQR
jgi:hypothetical protein